MHKLLLTPVMLVSLASTAGAQTDMKRESPAAHGRFFAGGSALLWSTHGAAEPALGFFDPQFTVALGWPAAGVMLNGGVFLGPRWSVGGELALRRPRSATMSEVTRGKFEQWKLSSSFTDRERTVSFVVRRHLRAAATVNVEPLGGVTISSSTRSNTNRRGIYEYFGGSLPIERPDRSAQATRAGLVGGADLVFRTRTAASISLGGRLHLIQRPDDPARDSVGPAQGGFVLQIGAGLRWRPRS